MNEFESWSGPTTPVDLRTDRPHPARMYDFYLGGKDNFPADREAAERVLSGAPFIRTTARENRAFLGRAVRWLAKEAGIRQFLDIGTGLPAAGNTHEVAQDVDPAARIAYVDNDPIVLAHARALLTGTREGRTCFVHADLRKPETILAAPEIKSTLDLDQPVALLLVAVLHFLEDTPDPDDAGNPYRIVEHLLQALVPGSYVVISHVTGEYRPEQWAQIVDTYHQAGLGAQVRSREQIRGFVRALEEVPPGVAPVSRWRPDSDRLPEDAEVSCYGLIARKPGALLTTGP